MVSFKTLAVLVVLLLAVVGPSLARIFVLDDGISDGDVVVDVDVDGIVSASNSTVSTELERQGDILPSSEDVSSVNSSEISQTNKTIVSSPLSGDQNVSNVEAQDRSDNNVPKVQDRSDSIVQEAQDRRDSLSWTPVTFVKDKIPINRGHSIYTDLGMTQRPPPPQTSEINRPFYDETLQKPSTPSVYQDQGTTRLTYNDGIRVSTSYKTVNPSQGEFQLPQQTQNSPLNRGVQTFPQIEEDVKDSQRPQANFLTPQKQETAQFHTDPPRDFHFSHISRKIPHTIRGFYIPQQSQRDIQSGQEGMTNFQVQQQQQQQYQQTQQQQQYKQTQQQQPQPPPPQQQQQYQQTQQQPRQQQQQYQQTQESQQQQYQQTQQQQQHQQTQQQPQQQQYQQTQQQQQYQQTQQQPQQQYEQTQQRPQQQQQQYQQTQQQPQQQYEQTQQRPQQQQQQVVNSLTQQKNTFHISGEESQKEDPRSSRSIENLRSYTSPPVRHNERQLDNNVVINAAGKSITLIPFTLEDHRDHNSLTTSNYPDQAYRQYKRQTDHISSQNKPSTFQTASYVTKVPVNISLDSMNITPSPSPTQTPLNTENSKETNQNTQPEFITDFNKGLISHDSGISPTRNVEKYTLNPYSSQTTTDPRLQQTEGFTNDTESETGNGTRASRQFGGHPFGVRHVPTFDRHRVPLIIRPHPKTKLGYGMRVRIQPPPPNSIHHMSHGPPRDNHMSPSSNVGRYVLPPNTITYGKQKPGSNGGPTTVNHPNNQEVSSNPQTNDERYLHQPYNPNVEYRPNGGYYSLPSGPPHDPNRPYKGQKPSGGFDSQLNSNKYNIRPPHQQSQQQFNKLRFPQGPNAAGGQYIQGASTTNGGRNEENQDSVNSGSTISEQYEPPRDSSPYKKPNFGFDDGVGHASSSSSFSDKSRFPSSVQTQPNSNRYQSPQQNSQYDQQKFGFEDVSSLTSPDRNRFPGGKDNVGSSSLNNERYSLPSAIQYKKPHYGFEDHAPSSNARRPQDSIPSQSSTTSHYAFPQLSQNPKQNQAEKYSGSLRESDDAGESGEVDEYDSEEDSNSGRKLKSRRPSTYNKSNKYFMNSEITRYTTVPTHGNQPNPGSFSPANSSPGRNGQRPSRNSQHGATSLSSYPGTTTRQPSELDNVSAASVTPPVQQAHPQGSIPFGDQRHGHGNGDSGRQSSGPQTLVGNNRPPGHRPSNNSPPSVKSSNKPPPPQVSYNKSKPVQNFKPPGSKPEDQIVASSDSHGPAAVASHGAPSVSYGPPPSHVSYGPPSGGGGGGGGHKKGVTGPVFTFAKTDYHGNVKWGVRHKVGSQYAGHKGGGGGEYGH